MTKQRLLSLTGLVVAVVVGSVTLWPEAPAAQISTNGSTGTSVTALENLTGNGTDMPASFTTHWWLQQIESAIDTISFSGPAESSVFSDGAALTPIGLERRDTPGPGTAVINGDIGTPGMSAFGGVYVNLLTDAGAIAAFATDATHGQSVATTGPQSMVGALAHGANPTAVTAGQAVRPSANRAGVQFVIGGHPNVFTREAQIEDADGAQTNAAIVTVAAGLKIVVTLVVANCDGSTTNPTNIVVGFGTATIPARAHTGVSGILAAFDGVPAGGGKVKGDGSGIIGIGADDEDVRITTEDPVGGACSVEVSGYTIES